MAKYYLSNVWENYIFQEKNNTWYCIPRVQGVFRETNHFMDKDNDGLYEIFVTEVVEILVKKDYPISTLLEVLRELKLNV